MDITKTAAATRAAQVAAREAKWAAAIAEGRVLEARYGRTMYATIAARDEAIQVADLCGLDVAIVDVR